MNFRSNLSTLTSMEDERPVKLTDSYLTSTISATSGLGSNYTTNTSGSGSTQLFTPSPRRKTSATSFSDVNELPENDLTENQISTSVYGPNNYFDCRLQSHENYFPYQNTTQTLNKYYSNDDSTQSQRGTGYFGKLTIDI